MNTIRILVEISESGFNNSYYHVPTNRALHEVALSIFKDYDADGMSFLQSEPTAPSNPGFTKDEIDKLPKILQRDAVEKLDMYRRNHNYYLDQLEEWALVKAARNGDGNAAWNYLSNYGNTFSKYIDGYKLVVFNSYDQWKKENNA
jgi:hypothetical protein